MYEKSQQTIAQILQAAQRLFVHNSYDDITMKAIAAEADVTKGAIYHHFKGKEALYLRMMVCYLDALRGVLDAALHREGSAQERLMALTAAYLNQPLDQQRTIQLVRRDANRFAEETRTVLIRAYQNALHNPIEVVIAEGIAYGEIIEGNARLLAWQFIAIVEIYLSDYARSQFDDPTEMARHVTALFFEGVGRD